MTHVDGPPVGLVLGSALAPEEIGETARLGERLGFSELWLAEDYFFTGGISGAAIALAATERLPVGLGIVSAMVRHPAVLAMEISTLSRAYPGRLLPGIGLGVPAWVEQMGLTPRSQLGAMRECVTSVRRLLAGEELTQTGASFSFDNVQLTYPAQEQPPVYMGVIGPKMLELSGEVADGTIGSVLASPQYVTWARERIAAGRTKAGRSGHHPFAAFAMFLVDGDGAAAKREIRKAMAFYLAAMPSNAMTEVYGIKEAAIELAKGGPEAVEREMPDEWVEDLVIAGEPDECAEKIRRFLAAGADSVVLFPVGAERTREMVELAAATVLPQVR
jgi:alkanesulfonate monooxygenase SsuD/methylene tetrahydromethanopterin reductase-like flavin-dependent oxidoreductase (luciferase family)